MSDTEIMVPRTAEVTIDGKKYIVKSFCLRDLLKFGRELIDGLQKIKEKFPEADLSRISDITILPFVLDEVPKVVDLIAMSIGKDGDWLSSQHDLAGVTNLFSKVCELNDFGAIISNFRDGWSKLKKQTVRTSAEQ